ncbi:bifunctional metallophosphatase/5'-nucleotidase [Paenibacillus chartarius]|uniref:Bifunctional metallophosphatase/5'-nucleotidase n=1 Tax=Paenibacillus chartarius TaxID=747481 RepID=A0ABV6DN39_9BACL
MTKGAVRMEPVYEQQSERLEKLTIIHTNDIHSHFESMPRIASFIRTERERLGSERVLAVDIGDHLDRMSPETEGTGGRANVDVLNATGIEAFVPGNNEGLTLEKHRLRDAFAGRASFPVICANLRETSTGQIPAWMTPSHIVRKGGLRIGLTGATFAYPIYYTLLGWEVDDPLEAVAKQAARLKQESDIVVVLSHLGLRLDERMAAEVPGIDVILGGHTHHVLEQPLQIGAVTVCGAGKFGQHAGVVELSYDRERRRIVSAAGRVVDVGGWAPDVAVGRVIAESRRESAAVLGETVALLKQPVPLSWTGESPLGNLMASGLRAWAGAELGLVNAGQALAGLPAGPVTRSAMLSLCPGPINPCRLRLLGKHIRQALEEALLPEFTALEIRGLGFRGKVLGTLAVDGLTVEADLDRPAYERIRRIQIDGGGELEDEREYVVGTIDMFTFGSGYLSLGQGTHVEYMLPELLREVLAVQLRSEDALRDCYRLRWKLTGDDQPQTAPPL